MLRMPSGVLMKSLFVGAPVGVRTLTCCREGRGGEGENYGVLWRQQPRCRGLRSGLEARHNVKSLSGATRNDLRVSSSVSIRNLGSRPPTSIAAEEPRRSRGPSVDTPSSATQRKPFRPSPRPAPGPGEQASAIEGQDASSGQRRPFRPSPPSPPFRPSPSSPPLRPSPSPSPLLRPSPSPSSSLHPSPSPPPPTPPSMAIDIKEMMEASSMQSLMPSKSFRPSPPQPELKLKPDPEPEPVAREQLPPEIEAKEMDELVAVATKVVDASGDIIRTLFRTKMDVADMDDENPMTVAEGTAEYAMSMLISQHFPTHAMCTEGSGLQYQDNDSDFIWVMDPVYGADSFMSGKPLFGTLLSLVYKGVPILGIIDQPILRERWIGIVGKETTLNGEPATTRYSTKALKDVYMFGTSPHLFSASALDSFYCVRDKVKVPQYGGDCYAYGLLAAGHVDLVIESGVKAYDFLALIPVIQGAGGYITDWQGQKLKFSPKSVDGPGGGQTEVLAAGSGAVHKAALAALSEGKK